MIFLVSLFFFHDFFLFLCFFSWFFFVSLFFSWFFFHDFFLNPLVSRGKTWTLHFYFKKKKIVWKIGKEYWAYLSRPKQKLASIQDRVPQYFENSHDFLHSWKNILYTYISSDKMGLLLFETIKYGQKLWNITMEIRYFARLAIDSDDAKWMGNDVTNSSLEFNYRAARQSRSCKKLSIEFQWSTRRLQQFIEVGSPLRFTKHVFP